MLMEGQLACLFGIHYQLVADIKAKEPRNTGCMLSACGQAPRMRSRDSTR